MLWEQVCLRHFDLSEVVTTAAKNSNSAQLIVNLLVVVMLSRKQLQYLTCNHKYRHMETMKDSFQKSELKTSSHTKEQTPLRRNICVIVGAKCIISWAFHRHINREAGKRVEV